MRSCDTTHVWLRYIPHEPYWPRLLGTDTTSPTELGATTDYTLAGERYIPVRGPIVPSDPGGDE